MDSSTSRPRSRHGGSQQSEGAGHLEWRNSVESRYSSFENGGVRLSQQSWTKRGEVSDAANEILMDSRLSRNGNEKQLYTNAPFRLSAASTANDGQKMQEMVERLRSASVASRAAGVPSDLASNSTDIMQDVQAAMALPPDAFMDSNTGGANDPLRRTYMSDQYGSLSMISNAESEDLSMPPAEAEWEGYLLKKSEWFRKMERFYFVLKGKRLMRFRDKEHALSLRVNSPGKSIDLSKGGVDTYIVTSVKDELPAKQNDTGFIVGYGKARNLHLVASSPVEKMVWTRIMLEAMAASPDIPLPPLDVDEFYAMLVVLYTANSGEWRTEGDMAVTLPPPSEQVISRFFALLDPDILLTSNYPPSVPFHGRFSGYDGFLRFWAIFADHVRWSQFKVEGIQVEKRIAVASGREQLANKNDDRKFFQNWVHKFDFSSEGKMTRIEINGDVVAASAVFKAPGAASTLRLPQDHEEVRLGQGLLLVRVMQTHALRNKKPSSLKDVRVQLSLPALEAEREASTVATSTPEKCSEEGGYAVWNQEVNLRLSGSKVRTAHFLQVEVMDPAQETHPKVVYGSTQINLAPFLRSGKPVEGWHTLSNSKGDFCGQIQLTICAETDENAEDRHSKLIISDKSKKYRGLLNWRRTARKMEKDKEGSETSRSSGEEAKRPEVRRGWTSIALSSSSSDLKGQLDKFRNSTGEDDGSEIDEDGTTRTYTVCGAPFCIPKHYELVKVCGRGAYGVVVAATNVVEGTTVAIKKIIDCIWHPHELKQALREVKLMRHLTHENILGLKDLIPPKDYKEFKDIYMVIDLMEMDLHRVIYSKEMLSDDHIRFFLYQMLAGLDHMHKGGVIHRDLKPGNLLVNSNCELKICDFGLARIKENEDLGMTEYVVTRWYRAPELLLGCVYDEGVDIWAAGCIFAEMLGRKPLFPGRSYVHQLQLIMNVLGVPEFPEFKENPQAENLRGRQLLSKTPSSMGVELGSVFPNANPEAADLLWKMLTFDPSKRITIAEAFTHPYLAPYYDPAAFSQPVARLEPGALDFSKMSHKELKMEMIAEIVAFHPSEKEKRDQWVLLETEETEELPPGWYKRESRKEPGRFYYCNPKRGISTWVRPTE